MAPNTANPTASCNRKAAITIKDNPPSKRHKPIRVCFVVIFSIGGGWVIHPLTARPQCRFYFFPPIPLRGSRAGFPVGCFGGSGGFPVPLTAPLPLGWGGGFGGSLATSFSCSA